MTFQDRLLAFLSYDESGSFAVGRLGAWWSDDERKREAPVLAHSLVALGALGLIEVYSSVPNKVLRYAGGVRVDPTAMSVLDVEAALSGRSRTALLLVATPECQNQIDLANVSAEERDRAAVFPDPEYADPREWGTASLWPNLLACEIGHRLLRAVDEAPTTLNLTMLKSRFDDYASYVSAGDESAIGALTALDVMCGLLWIEDAPRLGAFSRMLTAGGAPVLPVNPEEWTVNTIADLPIHSALSG